MSTDATVTVYWQDKAVDQPLGFGLALPPLAHRVRFCIRSLGVDQAVIERALSRGMARRDQAA
jgi:hypothetical protein